MRLIQELRAHLHYKIILPFLLLTLLVALAGSAVSFLLITGSAQERLNNQLAAAARATSDALVNQEQANLVFLREVAFAGPNPQTGAPAIADALADQDSTGLALALDPYFRIGAQRPGVRADRLIAFDASRRSLIDWELTRDPSGAAGRIAHGPRDLGALWFVPAVLAGQHDDLGDKFAGLLDLSDSETRYLFTVAPVFKGDRVVGGLIVAARLDTILQALSASSQTAIITLYRAEDGSAFASTAAPANGLAALDIRPELVASIRDLQLAQEQGIFDVIPVNAREHQFAYAPLRLRSSLIGLISAGLARDYVTGPVSAAGPPLGALTIALMLAIIGLGIFIARQITRPLQELVATAQAVTAGDLERRSTVTVQDEIGLLSDSFNGMTAHLLDLYRAVHAEASQRAAIVESITDGVVVCDPAGLVLVINHAMRALLGLAEDAAAPRHFEDIPLSALGEAAPAFDGVRAADLFDLRDQVVRVSVAPVLGEGNARIGDVYVFQNLTGEVAMDRAKTNFIATISHELRTPLTVLGGSAELLLRNVIGPLAEDQRMVIEGMHKHTQAMTSLLNNVITIACLESGTLTFDIEPIALDAVLDGILWPIRRAMAAKALSVVVEIPEDLPNILADAQQLRGALQQLLDNARRYSDAGTITIRATQQGELVRIDISDSGRGIDPKLCEHLFTRFTRGSEGINSAERGIGLGLSIARQLIERQGGTLWLDRTSEHGSTFSLTLPCVDESTHHNNRAIATAA